MPTKAVFFALFLPISAAAEEPLSAIQWLGEHPPPDLSGSILLEPPITKTALRPSIDVSRLEKLSPPVGLVPPDVTGLPDTLWMGSDPDTLADLISNVPIMTSPAMQSLLYKLLLSEARPPAPAETAENLLLARIDRLLELGATDPAQALVEQAGPRLSRDRFRRWFDSTLLTGDEDQSCAALLSARYLAPDYGAHIFCSARGGDWQTAALMLEAAHALDLLTPEKLALLDRFLSPDIFDGAPPLPAPQNPDPLTFRLFEAIGERLPTASHPRAFATADLRDIAGWKSQLEAAERLTRIGALSPNRLLGLYTERRPSASGGIWDRVTALQKFDMALTAGNETAITKSLPSAWQAMQSVGLEVPFALLFADQLAKQPLSDPKTRDLVWRIQLLSPSYRNAARIPPEGVDTDDFLTALAQGTPGKAIAPNATARAITDGFTDDTDPISGNSQQTPRQLGESILLAMEDFDSGARGNQADLSRALATFRKVGLEDTARSAALQLMLIRER